MSDQSRRTLRLLPDAPSPEPHAPVPSRPSPLRGYRIMALGSNAAVQAPPPADPPAPQPKRLEPITQFLSTDALFARREMLPPGPYVPVDPIPAAPPASDVPKPAQSETNDARLSRATRIVLILTVTTAAVAALAALAVVLLFRPGGFLRTFVKPTATPAVLSSTGNPSPPRSAPRPPPKEDARATPAPKVVPLATAGASPAAKNGSRTPQRAASDALASGEFAAALELYRELSRSNPGHAPYEKAVQVLERRVSAGAVRSGATP